MATARKKTTRKKRAAPKGTKATQQARKQMWAVVLFASGILLGALTLIEGEALWRGVHKFLFGVFSWSAYILPPLIIYIAVIAAMDKPLSEIRTKLWQAGLLMLMISAGIQIYGPGLPDEGSLTENLLTLFSHGLSLKGGGVAGAILAAPLLTLAGELGAQIIIVLAICVFFMLVTGSTLMGLIQSAKKPLAKVESVYVEAVESQKGKSAGKPAIQIVDGAKAKKEPAKFDIDVDISGDSEPGAAAPEEDALPVHPVIAEGPEQPTDRDRPVEYISPEEFASSFPPVPEPEPSGIRLSHPLDEEIVGAEESARGPDMESVIGRFSIEADAEEIESIQLDPIPEPNPAAPATANGSFRPGGQDLIPGEYKHPPITLLKRIKSASSADLAEEQRTNAKRLVDTLLSFGVQTRVIHISPGPAVTRYELQPSAGVKISKITGLSDDIALSLASAGIRIEAPIPNKAAVGIEVPNKTVSTVSIREILAADDFAKSESSLTVALGRDIAGQITLGDLGKMPHVLIAGATGSGKSVCINSIIVSLLYKSSPDEVKLLMVDPKVVELGIYNGIPHLLVPVVTDPKKAAGALGWAVTEMLNRYKVFADNAVRDLAGYNRLCQTNTELKPMPKIVIIIDELADLMMAAPNEVEDSICRLAQMARAAGMHLVIATQRPSVDVITGVIKANIPSRIAFAVSSAVDSRTILDMGGAEKLLGRGDMLYYPVGASKPMRVQGCFVTDGEVEKVVEFIKAGDATSYDQQIVEEIDRHVVTGKQGGKDSGGDGSDEDEMLPQAIECVVEMGQASTSSLQRRLKLGYARAARIIDQLEQKGIVGPFEGSKPRQVLISKERWMEMKLSGAETSLLQASEAPEPELAEAGREL